MVRMASIVTPLEFFLQSARSNPKMPGNTSNLARTQQLQQLRAWSTQIFSSSGVFMSQRFEPTALVAPFEHLRITDVDSVGGKNASLGQMISQLAASGVRVPGGFATTAHSFREFLTHNQLTERINA